MDSSTHTGNVGMHFLAGILKLDSVDVERELDSSDVERTPLPTTSTTPAHSSFHGSVEIREIQDTSRQNSCEINFSSISEAKISSLNDVPCSSTDLNQSSKKPQSKVPGTSSSGKTKNSLWRCSQCPVAYDDCELYTEHMQEHLEISKACKKYKRKSRDDITPNEDNSWNLYGKLVCNFCSKGFLTQTQFFKHINTHVGERKHICIICERRFLTKYKLKDHFLNMHMEKVLYNCDFCNKGFNHKYILRHHIVRVHVMKDKIKDLKRYPCSACDKAFEFKSQLKIHFRSHSGEKPFMCNICGKSCGMKATLKKHLEMHETDIECICFYCDLNFGSKFLLYEHLRIHYNDNEKLPCTKCSKSFRSLQSLVDHTRTHSGDKPFICEHCGKTFALAGNMRKHQKRVHKLQVQFKCSRSRCSKMFSTKDMLDYHMANHTEPKRRKKVNTKKVVFGKEDDNIATVSTKIPNHYQEYQETAGFEYTGNLQYDMPAEYDNCSTIYNTYQ